MASTRTKLGIDDQELKKSYRGYASNANSDTETVNNDEEDDIVEPTSTATTRLKRQGTKKKVIVRKRRITANISATKYDVGKQLSSNFYVGIMFCFHGLKAVIIGLELYPNNRNNSICFGSNTTKNCIKIDR